MNTDLQRALARFHADQMDAKPRAQAVLDAITQGHPRPKVPESLGRLPEGWPWEDLPQGEARQLLWCCEALPGRAEELCALWWG